MSKLPCALIMERLRATPPSLITIEPNLMLHRIYKRGGNHPTLWKTFRNFGPLSRFDHHLVNDRGEAHVQERSVFYAATDIPTALAEYFQGNDRRINRFRDQPWLVSFRLAGQVQLLNLSDTFCVRIGASMKLTSGPFTSAQAWSRGFYEAYPEIQGLYYPSSLTNRPTIAFYDRSSSDTLFPTNTRLHRELKSPLMHRALIITSHEIGYALI